MPIELDDIRSGYNLSKINSNFQRIEDAWDEKLDRLVNDQGNQMEQQLDMNSNKIINHPPTDLEEPTDLVRVDALNKFGDFTGVLPVVASYVGDGTTVAFPKPAEANDARTFQVYIGGLRQEPNVDYTVSGPSIVFVQAPVLGVAVDIYGFSPEIVEIGAPVYADPITANFVGDGTTINYFVSAPGSSSDACFISIDGVNQTPTQDFTNIGGAITFVEAPPLNSEIYVRIFAPFVPDIDGDLTNAIVTATGSTEPRTLGDRFAEVVNAKDFGAIGDGVTDDHNALQTAIDYAYDNKKALYIPAGDYLISTTLNVRFAETDYSVQETVIHGDGRNLTNIICNYTDNLNPIPMIRAYTPGGTGGYNLNIAHLSLLGVHSNTPALDGIVLENTLGYGDFDDLYIRDMRNAFTAKANMFLTRFTHIMMSRPKEFGIKMDLSGTSCFFDRCFVAQGGVYPDASQNPNFIGYQLYGVYMNAGALACDNSVGTAYDLRYYSGNIGSLGSENVTATGQELGKFIYSGFGNCTINYAYSLNVNPDADYIHHHHVAAGTCDINILRIADGRSQVTTLGQLLRQTNGFVRHGKISSEIEFTHLDTGAATTSDAIYESGIAGTGVTYSRGNRRPYIGANRNYYDTHGAQDPDRQVQAIYMDQYGEHWRGGSTGGINYQNITPPARGDWTMDSDPALHGIAGYSVTSSGSNWNTSTVAPILIGVIGDTANRPVAGSGVRPGAVYMNTDTGALEWFDGSNWRS